MRLSGGTDIRLTVGDDGVGWPAAFKPAESSSLGLRLVHILARPLHADLQRQYAQGICCTLTLRQQPGVQQP